MNYNTIVQLELAKTQLELNLFDFLLIPFYILLLLTLTKVIIQKFYKLDPHKKYIIPGMVFKFVGGLFITLIYIYYYKGGDTCNYFIQSTIISKILVHDILSGIELLFNDYNEFPQKLNSIKPLLYFGRSNDTYYLIKFTSIICLISMNNILVCTVLFSFFSFWGLWSLYLLCKSLYPKLGSPLAYSILFIPSVIVWGSGIFKDTIIITFLSILIKKAYDLFIHKEKSMGNILLISISIYIIANIKIYILFAMIPPLLILITYEKLKSYHNVVIKNFIIPIILVFLCLNILYVVENFNDSNRNYKIDNIMTRSKITREYLESVSNKENGSGYSLGVIEDSFWGYVKIIPSAINVTFFRPYLWESKNIVMLLSAVESLFSFLFFLYVVFKFNFIKNFIIIKQDMFVQFCLIFSLTLGYFAGISTYNFGSLVRYKIPALPFFISALVIIYYTKKEWYLKKQATTL